MGKGKSKKADGPAQWESITADAHRLVYGDRGTLYDHPALDYQRVCDLYYAFVGIPLDVPEAIAFMMCVKLSRLSFGLNEGFPPEMLRDSLTDLAGYAECMYGALTYTPEEPEEEDAEEVWDADDDRD